MKLKPEILEVLGRLGVEQNEINALIGYFTSKLAEYESQDVTTREALAVLQKRTDEMRAKLAATQRMRDGIAKFVDAD